MGTVRATWTGCQEGLLSHPRGEIGGVPGVRNPKFDYKNVCQLSVTCSAPCFTLCAV